MPFIKTKVSCELSDMQETELKKQFGKAIELIIDILEIIFRRKQAGLILKHHPQLLLKKLFFQRFSAEKLQNFA